MALGVFPGSFNPPTVAHLAIAEAAWRQCQLERVDLVVSRSPLGKEPSDLVRLEDRVSVLERIAAGRPWLGVGTTDARLLVDVADGYDVLIVGGDKLAQLVDPIWYGGSEHAHDDALHRIRRLVVAPRGTHSISGCEVLELPEAHLEVSATEARSGRTDWMAAEAVQFDVRTGAWTDAARYRRWLRAGEGQRMNASAQHAHLLEERIGDHFAAHDYVVRRNAYVHGRSGGRHEIDVLAEKSDPLTTFRLAVECKAWESPIEKDAVSKLSYVLADVGLNKGIIVALRGWRAGAEQAAIELGIDLWGPAELDRRLGGALTRQLDVGPPARLARGQSFAAPADRARTRARLQGKGRLGLRTVEHLGWFGPVWVPMYRVDLSICSTEVRRGRERFLTRTVTNIYEAVSGTFQGPASPEDRDIVDIDLSSGAIKPGVRDTKVVGEIRRGFERWNEVQQEAAKLRHAAVLEALGVEVPCRGVTVDDCTLVYAPTYVGWLSSGEHERVVALSGVSGALSERLSAVLTSHISHVRSSLFEDQPA